MTNEIDRTKHPTPSSAPNSDVSATGIFNLVVVPDVSDNNVTVAQDVVGLLNDIGRDGAGDATEALVVGQGHESHQGRIIRPVPFRKPGEPIVDVRIQGGTLIQTSEIEPSQELMVDAQKPISGVAPISQAITFTGTRREFIVRIISKDSIDTLGLRNLVTPRKKAA